MKVETFRCDNCDKARDKDVNHWSTVVGWPKAIIWTGPFDSQPGMCFQTPQNCAIVHACGDECRFALMARYLATGSFARTPVGAKAGK